MGGGSAASFFPPTWLRMGQLPFLARVPDFAGFSMTRQFSLCRLFTLFAPPLYDLCCVRCGPFYPLVALLPNLCFAATHIRS